MAFLNNEISIRYRLMGWLFAVVLIASVAASATIYSSVRETLDESISVKLRNATDAIGVLVRTLAGSTASNPESGYRSIMAVDGFVDGVQSLAVGKEGYPFIMDGGGNIVLHPWLAGTVLGNTDAEGKFLFREMIQKRKGSIAYSWKGPDDESPREKLMVFLYIPEMDWIVASTCYLDEMRGPLVELSKELAIMVVLALVIVLPVGYHFGTRFTHPIIQLATSMGAADHGDFSVRAEISGQGEVSYLATQFNRYMNRLEQYQAELQTEVDERLRVQQQRNLFSMVFENAMEGISITDKEGNIIAVNPAFTHITGFEPEEVLGKNPRVLKSDQHEFGFYKEMWEALRRDGQWHGEIWNRRKNGESFPEILSISAVTNEKGDVINYVALFHDISDMKHKDEQIQHQAYHDPLTGLPNRTLARDRLGVALAHAKREGTKVIVLSLDLDDFKKVNDSFGHSKGDMLIRDVGERLKNGFHDADTVARLGGDEFLILLEHVTDDREAVEIAEKVLKTFIEPFYVGDQELSFTPSVGVTLYPDDGKDPDTLIKNADMAMYQSKARGKNSYFLFTQEVKARISRSLELEMDVRHALKSGDFTVYFQPKVAVGTGKVTGMEALVRWIKEDGTVVSPGDFIPLAEETGLIVPLGEYVLEASCKAMQLLEGVGCTDIKMSVNLSPIQFGQEDMVEKILANLDHNGLSPDKLELEITESTLMTDVGASVAKLNELGRHGISIAIDDFGTGHSSLYYLKKLPIDVLKIDQSFIRDVTTDDSDAQIVKAIIAMGQNLGLETVAEGVETKEQLDILDSFGCKLVQGYYYSRPLPLEEVIEYFHRNNSACAL